VKCVTFYPVPYLKLKTLRKSTEKYGSNFKLILNTSYSVTLFAVVYTVVEAEIQTPKLGRLQRYTEDLRVG